MKPATLVFAGIASLTLTNGCVDDGDGTPVVEGRGAQVSIALADASGTTTIAQSFHTLSVDEGHYNDTALSEEVFSLKYAFQSISDSRKIKSFTSWAERIFIR